MIDTDRTRKAQKATFTTWKIQTIQSTNQSGAPYIVQVRRNQTVEELRRVGATLRRADDGTVPCENVSKTWERGAKTWLKCSFFCWGLVHHLLRQPLPAAPDTAGRDCTSSPRSTPAQEAHWARDTRPARWTAPAKQKPQHTACILLRKL